MLQPKAHPRTTAKPMAPSSAEAACSTVRRELIFRHCYTVWPKLDLFRPTFYATRSFHAGVGSSVCLETIFPRCFCFFYQNDILSGTNLDGGR
jgi:hypothetical protein